MCRVYPIIDDKTLPSLLNLQIQFYLFAHMKDLLANKRQKNHLDFKGNFYFKTLPKILFQFPSPQSSQTGSLIIAKEL